ncbi:MAG: hypothetical protein Q7T73_21880, partial [Beijerinckiaceae bacterium]|nr:hypothetical protein [Beijerinckiaceae bacterium]
TDDLIENIAVLHNGGTWPKHYSEAHREHWRAVARQIILMLLKAQAAKEAPVPFSLEHYVLDRDPDESDEEFAARQALFEPSDQQKDQ